MHNITLLLATTIFLLSFQPQEKLSQRDLELWYSEPAQTWTEALPVGNGRLGAMVFGGIENERIQLNEESLWTGGPVDRANPEALQYINIIRQLLFEGKYVEAEKLAQEKIMGPRLGRSMHTYQTLGDLYFHFKGLKDISDYKRFLDLRTATTTVTFKSGDVDYKREVFSSYPGNVIVIRLTASDKGKLSFTTWMNRPGDVESVSVEGKQLKMKGFAQYGGRGTHFASVMDVRNEGGEMFATDTSLIIKNADQVLILVSGRTGFWGEDEVSLAENDINQLKDYDFQTIRTDHIRNYQELFSRVDLSLNEQDTLNIPTDQRLERIKKGEFDPHFTELYFQFGRYLLISSSRPGGLPANLQGIWEPTLSPPWNADYHININLQMNYWPALVTNLEECQYPFFDFIEGLRGRGRITARETYGCRGFVAHHTTDAWKFTAPVGKTYWGLWPMGAAWCSDHFWEHYHYTGDEEFLEKRAYPLMKEAAVFFMDYLVKNPETGLLVSGPSMSPENNFVTDEGERASICMGPAMDHQIIRELYHNCIKSTKILDVDNQFADSLKIILEKLTPSHIGSDGRILEWSEELAEADSGHRHMSHLYALYPGEEFADPDDKWMPAARKSLETRLSYGGGHTGWSRAWIINFFARLQDAEKAHENLLALFAKSTHPNLFDNHPPFQIDGNFGGTAGIAEMLMQSHLGVIQILPALPDKWGSGHINGLRARGGFEVDIEWQDSELKRLKIKSLLGNPCIIKYQDRMIAPEISAGAEILLDETLELVI